MITPEQLKKYLDVLSNAAKPISDKAEMYYQLAVRQQYFEALEYLLWTLAGVALIIGGKRLYTWSLKFKSYARYDQEGVEGTIRGACFVGMIFAYIVGAAMICVNLSQAASHVFNAQYWAIRAMIP